LSELDSDATGFLDRPATPRTIEDARIEAVIVRTLETKPPNTTHWSSRSMATASGLLVSTVQRIWRTFGLQPHRFETYKLSNHPDFVAKVRDVVGLYVVPPERAIVLCVGEKPQMLAPDRSQPSFRMRPGQVERHSHDYKRHGTTAWRSYVLRSRPSSNSTTPTQPIPMDQIS